MNVDGTDTKGLSPEEVAAIIRYVFTSESIRQDIWIEDSVFVETTIDSQTLSFVFNQYHFITMNSSCTYLMPENFGRSYTFFYVVEVRRIQKLV